jgi:hypothetical protein
MFRWRTSNSSHGFEEIAEMPGSSVRLGFHTLISSRRSHHSRIAEARTRTTCIEQMAWPTQLSRIVRVFVYAVDACYICKSRWSCTPLALAFHHSISCVDYLNHRTLYLLDFAAFPPRHQASKHSSSTTQSDETSCSAVSFQSLRCWERGLQRTSGPRGSVDSIVTPHVVTQHGLQRGVRNHHINHERQLPRPSRWCALTRESCGLLPWFHLIIPGWRTEPRFILRHQALHGGFVVEVYDPNAPVEIAEAPWCEAETGHAEQRVENLAVDFDPDLAW